MNNHRRRKKRHTHGTKTVDVSRGKTGYGFTISGQQPCILSCIVAGSPADRAGLKTGDYLLHVNNLNVAKASHDEVVRMIGSSSGTLTLIIAENYNDSDSSDDDFQARPKSKYPNRVRLRQYQGKSEKDGSGGFGRERSENVRGRQAGSIQQHKKQAPPMRSRALSPVVERYGRNGSRGVHVDHGPQGGVWYPHHHQNPAAAVVTTSGGSSRGVENMDPLSVAVYPRRQKHASAGPAPLRPPQGTKHTIITREMRMVKSQSHPEVLNANLQALHPRVGGGHPPHFNAPHQPQSAMTAQDLSNILYPSIQPHLNHQPSNDHVDHDPSLDLKQPNLRIIVGYVGSVEMPRDAHMPCSRQQSIRSAVRRLRVDHRVHTLVLMEIYVGGIRMTNTLGSIVALYAADRIAFSGTYPDDKRFFGIVTLHKDDFEGDLGAQEDIMAGSSCHVFMVDPDMAVHSVHIQKAKSFGIHCVIDPITQMCQEFPQFASMVVKHISKLCRNRNSTMNEGEPEAQNEPIRQPQHGQRNSESNSSNSDSGLGFGREDPGAVNDQVYVVDMPNASHVGAHNASSSQDSSLNWTAERSAFHPADGSMYKSTGESDLSTMIPPNVRYQCSGTEQSMSSNINTSISSNDASFLSSHGHGANSTFDRLNLRVMPDPRGVSIRATPDVLDKQNSADNLRRSMHRYMQTQAQQRFMEHSGSDADSLRSNESNNSNSGVGPTGNVNARAKATRSQGVTAVDPSDPHKLSPRVFQQPGPLTHPVSSSGDPYEFLVPAVPVLTKPPVPGRPPMLPPKSYGGAKTPLRDRPLPERPKSTPPFRGNMVTPPPLATEEEYDSDPGSVMGMGVDDEEWNGKIAGPDDDEEEERAPKEKRRFSEGFFIKKTRDKENVENSRLAKGGSFKQIKIKRRPTLSTSHESLVVSDAVDFAPKKLNGAPSATSIHQSSTDHHPRIENGGPPQHGQRSARWAIGFDRLLDDRAGLATFTEFLKKEFSQENINFWVKCENFKHIEDEEERTAEAGRLWEQHLSQHSSESVNVDAATLSGVQEGLQMAPPTLFDGAQAHIFQLMKQDSYPRFLKSELYKQCVVAEMEGKPLPFSGLGDDEPRPREEKKVTFGEVEFQQITKSKSTVSMDKNKRRQSFFPFSWNKSKSEKRLVKPTTGSDADLQRWAQKKEDGTVRLGVASLDLVDLHIMSREIRAPVQQEDGKDENSNKEVKLCRVILPDGSTTVLHAKPGTPIRATLQHLCQRRTLSLPSLEVYQQGSEKALDLTRDASILASKEIRVERRVLFQADLPSRRPLVIRAKPTVSVRDALKPILPKYGCKGDNMVAHLVGCDAAVDLDTPVSKVEGQRLLIQTEEDFAEWGGFGSHRGKPPIPSRSKSTASLDSGGGGEGDDDLVKDMLDGRLDVAHLFDEHGVFDPEKKHDKPRGEDGRASGIFGFIRRNSIGEKDATKFTKTKQLSTSSKSQPASLSGPPDHLDRPRARPRPPVKDREAENLFEQLNKLSNRLDDQRGLSKADLELPDFLKVDPSHRLSTTQNDSSLNGSFRNRERRNSDSSILDAETSRRLSQSVSQENVSMLNGGGPPGTPTSTKIPYMDQSFSQDGIVPSHSEADQVFSTARHYPGSPDMTWQSSTTGNTLDRDRSQRQAGHGVRSRPGNNNTASMVTSSPRRKYSSPRSRTPDPKRTLLWEVNGYTRKERDAEDDLGARPLVSGDDRVPSVAPRGEITLSHNSQGESSSDYPPSPRANHKPTPAERPTPRARKPAPLPPPRKTLSTPKKFLPPPATPTAHGARHGSQNSTSSDMSQHSAEGANPGGRTTPSPTTHELVIESSPERQVIAPSPRRTRPQPPPRPSRRGGAAGSGVSSGGSSADEGSTRPAHHKTLNFEEKETARQKENGDNMQVSYV